MHGPHATLANGCQQLLETGARGPAARSSEVIVNDLGVGPPKLTRTLDQTILAPLALQIVGSLGTLSIDGHRRWPCVQGVQA